MVYNVHAKSRKAQQKAARCRAWLNGVEITKRTFYADPRRGVVRCYKHNDAGRPYLENVWAEHWNVPAHLRPRVATEELRGRVVVRKAA